MVSLVTKNPFVLPPILINTRNSFKLKRSLCFLDSEFGDKLFAISKQVDLDMIPSNKREFLYSCCSTEIKHTPHDSEPWVQILLAVGHFSIFPSFIQQ